LIERELVTLRILFQTKNRRIKNISTKNERIRSKYRLIGTVLNTHDVGCMDYGWWQSDGLVKYAALLASSGVVQW
jgi:hypothetical protein